MVRAKAIAMLVMVCTLGCTASNAQTASPDEAQPGIRRYLATTDIGDRLTISSGLTNASQTSGTPRRRSTGRKIAGLAIGGVGGFFGGAYLGAAIEGDRCNCDDPGLLGAVIGAPIGASVGAILGWKFF